MAISMAKTIKEERLRWVKPIAEKRVKLLNVEKVCPHSKRSLERWLSAYKRGGSFVQFKTALEEYNKLHRIAAEKMTHKRL